MKIHTLLFAPVIAVFFAIAAAGVARADPTTGDVSVRTRIPASQIGVSLGLGGSATGFTSSEASDVTSVGGGYELRSTIGTRLPVAAEIAYVGWRRDIALPGVTGTSAGETPHMFSNGIEGAARIQHPFSSGSWLIEPFAFGGLGWSHIGVYATLPASSPMSTSDDVLVVPFGAGVGAGWNGLMFEARFTYRATFSEDLLKKADGTTASLNNWSVGGLVGYEF